MNKKELKSAKKTKARVAYRSNGFRYEGRIEIWDISGEKRCWFLGETDAGRTILLPLVDLTEKEKRKINERKQMNVHIHSVVERASKMKPGSYKEIIKETERFENIVTEKAPLKFFFLL